MPDFDVDFCMEKRDQVIDYVAETLRPRPGQPDHHLRHHGGQGRGARLRARAGPWLWLCRQHRQADPAGAGHYPGQGPGQRAGPGAHATRTRKTRAPSSTWPCRWRASPATPASMPAAWSLRPRALTDFTPLFCEAGWQQPGHPVRQGRCRDHRPGEVRLPGPAHAHHHRLGRADHQRACAQQRAKSRWCSKPCRWTMRAPLQLLQACQTTAVFQLESRGMKELIRKLQPDSFDEIIALVALFRPGPLESGMVDTYIDRKHGRKQVSYPHPKLERHPRAHQRRDPVPGTGDADRPGPGRLHAWAMPTCCAAPWARKSPRRWPSSGRFSSGGSVERDIPDESGRLHLRPDGDLRRLRLQQVTLGRLCADFLPDRLAQGASPGAPSWPRCCRRIWTTPTRWRFMIAECRDMQLTVCTPDINRSGYHFAVMDATHHPLWPGRP